MTKITPLFAAPSPCPVCGTPPTIEEVGPWPGSAGPVPWYAGCYRMTPEEHFVGVNGDSRADAIREWNAEVSKIARKDFDSPATIFPNGQLSKESGK